MIGNIFRLLVKGITVILRAFTTGNFVKRVPVEERDIPGEPLPDYSLPDALKEDDDTHR